MWTSESTDYRKDVGSTLLLSAWHELFHGYTPDSFQPRLHNVSSLIDELVDIAGYWQADERFSTHVKKIQDELAATIKSESAILSRIPAYRSRAIALCSAKTPQRIVSGGEILAGLRYKYWRAFEHLAVQSMRELPRNKKAAMLNLRRLATFAFREGKEDDDVWDPIEKDVSGSPETTFSRLVAVAREPVRNYTCTLTILGDITGLDSAIRKCGHQQAPTHVLPTDYKRDLGFPIEKQLHVRVEVEANSIRKAVARGCPICC